MKVCNNKKWANRDCPAIAKTMADGMTQGNLNESTQSAAGDEELNAKKRKLTTVRQQINQAFLATPRSKSINMAQDATSDVGHSSKGSKDPISDIGETVPENPKFAYQWRRLDLIPWERMAGLPEPKGEALAYDIGAITEPVQRKKPVRSGGFRIRHFNKED